MVSSSSQSACSEEDWDNWDYQDEDDEEEVRLLGGSEDLSASHVMVQKPSTRDFALALIYVWRKTLTLASLILVTALVALLLGHRHKMTTPTTIQPPTQAPSEITSSAPSSIPTQTVAPTQLDIYYHTENDDPRWSIHLPFGPNATEYRRVCAIVHSSWLCLTVKYPRPFAVQDENYSYPHPVDEHVHDYDTDIYFVDGPELKECSQQVSNETTLDVHVQSCLVWYSKRQKYPEKSVVAMWTKGPAPDDMELYGIHQHPEQQAQRVDDFFRGQIVLILGDSTCHTISKNFQRDLFGECDPHWQIRPSGTTCNYHGLGPPRYHRRLPVKMDIVDSQDDNLGNGDNSKENEDQTERKLPFEKWFEWGEIPDSSPMFVGSVGYHMADKGHIRNHALPAHTLPKFMSEDGMRRADGFRRRNITFLVLHPIAHAQNQRTIRTDYEQVRTMQTGYVDYVMQVQKTDELAQAGYDLSHMIAFDGRPQFDPTETSAWGGPAASSKEKFTSGEAYEGWKPEFGDSCRGPVPPKSPYRQVNQLARQAYEEKGLAMEFYGRTFEFNNLFWYATKGWTPRHGLDCTHSVSDTNGLEKVHSYFLMAMIDDHFEQR